MQFKATLNESVRLISNRERVTGGRGGGGGGNGSHKRRARKAVSDNDRHLDRTDTDRLLFVPRRSSVNKHRAKVSMK